VIEREERGTVRHKIQKLLDEEVNPQVASHGGRIDMVDYVNRTVYLRMSGGCQGCSASAATLRDGVEKAVLQAFPRVKGVVDMTDHDAGSNPYYAS
jgi:Fe-S cluster biogenesis protein NfuA